MLRTAAPPAAALLALAALIAPPTASATEPQPRIDCANAMTTAEMNVCAERDLDKADAALNAAYQRALKAIPGKAVDEPYDTRSWEEALRKSQRAWLAYRDAECKDHTPMHWSGGTGTTVAVLGCLAALTEARTKELAAHYALE
jgi:uncharacterized protein YecT (DUF1311 family)